MKAEAPIWKVELDSGESARRVEGAAADMADLTLGEAAERSACTDTLRRWDRAGKLRTRATRATGGSSRPEVARLSALRAARPAHAVARNRFAGVVRSVEVDGVMALVEIEAGPFLFVAAVTRDSSRSSGWRPACGHGGGQGDLGHGRTRA